MIVFPTTNVTAEGASIRFVSSVQRGGLVVTAHSVSLIILYYNTKCFVFCFIEDKFNNLGQSSFSRYAILSDLADLTDLEVDLYSLNVLII